MRVRVKSIPKHLLKLISLLALLHLQACHREVSSTTHHGPLSEDSAEAQAIASGVLYDGSSRPFDDGSSGESCEALPGFGIVGGRPATPGDLTSLSTVHIFPAGCTGTLIGPRHVVTAAHCLKNILANSSVKPSVRFGLSKENPDLVIPVATITAHPAYGLSSNQNAQLFDVALILLDQDVPSPFKPVAIGSPQELNLGREIVLAGYGRYAEKDTLSRPLTWVATEIEELIDPWAEIQLTTGTGKAGCYGDSGGPTYIIQPKTKCLRVVGVTHGPPRKGDGTCDTGGETVMNLTKYRGWINCSYQLLEAPLKGFEADGSELYCEQNKPVKF